MYRYMVKGRVIQYSLVFLDKISDDFHIKKNKFAHAVRFVGKKHRKYKIAYLEQEYNM